MKTDEELIEEYRLTLEQLNRLSIELFNRKCRIMLAGSASGYMTNVQRGITATITKEM